MVFPIPPQTFSIGPLTFHFYSLTMTLAIVLGYFIAKKRAHLRDISDKVIDDILPYLVVFGILGARLYHVVDKWEYYIHHPFEIIAVWQGGIGIFGAILAGLAISYWYCKKYGISFLSLIDVLAPSVVLGQAIGRIGNYFNQEAFGPVTQGPITLLIDSAHRPFTSLGEQFYTPLFFYESLYDFCVFLVLILLSKRLRNHIGAVAAFYLMLFGIGRLVIEFYRFDTALIFGIKVAGILSILCILFGIILYFKGTQIFGRIESHGKNT